MQIDEIIVEVIDNSKPSFKPQINPAITVIGEHGSTNEDNNICNKIKIIEAKYGFLFSKLNKITFKFSSINNRKKIINHMDKKVNLKTFEKVSFIFILLYF